MGEAECGSENDGRLRQFTAAVIVNLGALSYGIICGWPSPMIPLFKGENNPVGDTPMSENGVSWIGGLICLGGFVISPFLGSLAEKLGRKRFSYVASLPMIAFWLLTIFATNHTCLYVARFIGGISGAMVMFIVPIYVSEIAAEKIRGALGSLLVFAINIGVLLAFTAGAFMPYKIFGIFSLMFPLLFLGAFIFLPETPAFLVRQNHLVEARRSLMFFKGNNKALADQELSYLQSQINNTSLSKEKPKLSDLLTNRATSKGLIIALGLLGGQQLSGINVMIIYAETIFKMSGSALSPATAAIIIGAIQVFGSYLSTILMERAGRRSLILISCAGMCICHSIVGSFCYLQNADFDVSSISWIPVVALSIYMISYCLGMGPVPFVIASEIFYLDITSLANTVCFLFLWGTAFVVMQLFNPIVNLINIGGCFFLLSIFCAGTFAFAMILVPETKGRKREEIADELAGNCKSNLYCDQKTYTMDRNTNDKNLMASDQV